MLSRFFSRRPTKGATPKASIPPGQRIYAIGDIHGRLDLLDELLAQIHADSASRAPSSTQIIFLGDLIDRGPQSAQVIDRLIALTAQPRAFQVRFLLGNHEEVLLASLAGDLKALKLFARIGGQETSQSYGISPEAFRDAEFPELLAMLQARVPAEHITFLEHFEDMITVGDYAFVHAGVRPERSLAAQNSSDLRWIRREFLEHRDVFEKVIVHGHTVTDEVEELHNRVGLDTGAFASGKLSAMGFEADSRWLLQTGR